MLHDPLYLQRAHELLKNKFDWSIVPGLRIARGFADVGFEEYSVLNARKMISLSTGQVGDIPENYREHFFPVYSADEMSTVVFQRHIDVVTIEYEQQRTWRGAFSKRDQEKIFSASTIEELFLVVLLADLCGKFDV